jgi:hypothetical protein
VPRKTACTVLLLVLLAAAPAQAQTVPTRAGLDSCHTGSAPLDRFAVLSAQMGSVAQSARMQVRFDLTVRLGSSGAFKRVSAPGLGAWRSSAPGVDIFRYRKQVANLQSGAQYRALVRFRWLTDAGRTIQSTTRRTKTCKQPDLRPDLVAGQITAEPSGQPGRARYTVLVRNGGRTAAPSFTVGFAVGDQPQPGQTVQPLAVGDERELIFVGPRCDGLHPLRVSVDSDLAVDESSESNNARTAACPLDG